MPLAIHIPLSNKCNLCTRTLLVVLFILLIIIGACYAGSGKY
ncbi:YjcZ family sporulation protein [Bacillus thermotolerans]|nr:YjcZ family sporulation protein [Bacillus thermotolerans]